jgi:hypothetical protein
MSLDSLLECEPEALYGLVREGARGVYLAVASVVCPKQQVVTAVDGKIRRRRAWPAGRLTGASLVEKQKDGARGGTLGFPAPSAEGGTRTHTRFPSPDFESGASTGSATSARGPS